MFHILTQHSHHHNGIFQAEKNPLISRLWTESQNAYFGMKVSNEPMVLLIITRETGKFIGAHPCTDISSR